MVSIHILVFINHVQYHSLFVQLWSLSQDQLTATVTAHSGIHLVMQVGNVNFAAIMLCLQNVREVLWTSYMAIVWLGIMSHIKRKSAAVFSFIKMICVRAMLHIVFLQTYLDLNSITSPVAVTTGREHSVSSVLMAMDLHHFLMMSLVLTALDTNAYGFCIFYFSWLWWLSCT